MSSQYDHTVRLFQESSPKDAIMKLPTPHYHRAALAATAMLAVLTLGACTTVPQSAPFAAENSSAKKANPIESVAEQAWWQDFGDAQLSSLMREAFSNSPTLAMAEARLNEAQAITGQYRSLAAPTIGVQAKTDEFKQSYNYLFPKAFLPKGYTDEAQVGLSFNWELDFWGKNRAAIAAATTNARAASADAAQARLVLSSAIASAYVELDRLYQSHDLADRAVEIRQDSAKLVKQKLDNGVSNEAEYDQAMAGVYAAQADAAELDEQIAITKHLIAALAGAAPDRADALSRPALSPNDKAFAGAPQQVNLDLIGRRPDVIAARWRAEAASANIKVAHAAFYPNINLAAAVGFQALGTGNLFKGGSDFGNVGPALSLPIFDGGRLNANLKSAEAEHALAIASYNQDILTAMQQVADALSSQRALTARLTASQKSLDAYEEAYKLTKMRYDGGLSNYTALLVAEQSLLNQRRAVADLKSRALTLDIALIKALGGQYSA